MSIGEERIDGATRGSSRFGQVLWRESSCAQGRTEGHRLVRVLCRERGNAPMPSDASRHLPLVVSSVSPSLSKLRRRLSVPILPWDLVPTWTLFHLYPHPNKGFSANPPENVATSRVPWYLGHRPLLGRARMEAVSNARICSAATTATGRNLGTQECTYPATRPGGLVTPPCSAAA